MGKKSTMTVSCAPSPEDGPRQPLNKGEGEETIQEKAFFYTLQETDTGKQVE